MYLPDRRRPSPQGPSGIVRSHREARSTLNLATQFGPTAAHVYAADLLLFQVLGERASVTDLAASVLGGLEERGAAPGHFRCPDRLLRQWLPERDHNTATLGGTGTVLPSLRSRTGETTPVACSTLVRRPPIHRTGEVGAVHDVPLWLWMVFAVTVLASLTVDLLAHRQEHVIRFREAAAWSGVWVGLALAFGALVFVVVGTAAGVEYTTAWLLEKSLSVDNLFVFALIFGYFKVPRAYQHRVLFLGVLGALVFRGIFLAAGVAVVSRFTAVLFVFAAILFYSTYKILHEEDDSFDPGQSIAVKLLRKIIPVRDEYAGTHFFVKEAGKRVATPLLAVVAAIEAADLVFAVDSVPAVLAVSSDAFIVYTSNAFAILGLRALYFMLAGLLDRFHYLSKGLALILAFIGVKLVLQASHKTISTTVPEIPSLLSLVVIVVVLAVSVGLSMVRPLAPSPPDDRTGSGSGPAFDSAPVEKAHATDPDPPIDRHGAGQPPDA